MDSSRVDIRKNSLIKNSFNNEVNIVSMTYIESKQFDELTCPKNEFTKSKFDFFLNSKGCGNNDLGEINASLKGIRTDISLYSKASVVKAWALNTK